MFFSKIMNPAKQTIYFVGIGGIGISGLAEIVRNLGFNVEGSDVAENANSLRLQKLGVKIHIGHSEQNIQNADFLVKSTAIPNSNVEILAAKEKHIPVLERAEMLAELMRFKCSVAISGSHGKTTTTSLMAHLFKNLGKMPTVISGGIINQIGTNAYLGEGEFLIAEADESDATFIKIPSTVAVITNVDPEHLDYYGTFDNLKKAFLTFIENLPFYGFAVLCADRPELMEMAAKVVDRKIITYSINANADLIAKNIQQSESGMSFDVLVPKNDRLPKSDFTIKNVKLPMHGLHNVSNSLAVLSVAIGFGFDENSLSEAFNGFEGVKRRFTKIDKINEISFIDDYAHHPAEIRATIATANSIITQRQKGKILAIIEPHRFSRLQNLFAEFTHAFDEVDVVAVTDVYSAGEAAIEGCSKEALCAAINQTARMTKAFPLSENLDIQNFIEKHANSDDFVIFMGAGAISKRAYEIVKLIKNEKN